MALQAFDQPELERFTQTFTELFDAADPDSMTSYYTGQAQLMADGITPIRGDSAIGDFWRTAGGGRRAAWDTTIWQRGSDGSWRIAVDISTALPS